LVLVGGEGGGKILGGFDRQILRAPLLSLFTGQTLRPLVAGESAKDIESLKELIEAGKVKSVIDRQYPLDKAPDAIRYLTEGHARGKVVITI
jgi:NADPH:quinone reductase-like Zn-dependent oxidoreductase